jgi:hypothetical protein
MTLIQIARLLAELCGWLIVAPLVLLFGYVIVCEVATCAIRRWYVFPHLWRIGFYAGSGRWLPETLRLRKEPASVEWVQLFDRWYWRISK